MDCQGVADNCMLFVTVEILYIFLTISEAISWFSLQVDVMQLCPVSALLFQFSSHKHVALTKNRLLETTSLPVHLSWL